MKITEISLHALAMPLHRPYKLSGGRLLFTELDSTFVRIGTDAGLAGWGEGCPWGHTYLPAHGPGIRAAAEILAPALLGLDPRRLEHVNRAMDLALPGHLYAKAPFDIACWDLLGKSTELPAVELLGGRYEAPTPIASSISTDTPENMLAEIDEYRARGYRAHSAKVGGDVRLDVERIRHLAAAERPGGIHLLRRQPGMDADGSDPGDECGARPVSDVRAAVRDPRPVRGGASQHHPSHLDRRAVGDPR